jgi:SAM-dependent methyltransferase
MEKYHQTFLEVVNHIIVRHPELAEKIRNLAQQRLVDTEKERLQTKEIFSKIYRDGLWGRSGDPNKPYFSGSGSHTIAITSVYVNAVSDFLNGFDGRPSVLDLGCGDFNVGSQIRSFCGSYIAVDIVSELIEFNRKTFSNLNVDFRVLDLVEDPLPQADIVFIRQVLQHLSNAQIQRLLPKLVGRFSWLVLTEHLPLNPGFPPNIDQENSHSIRLEKDSGVVLTSPPFNLKVVEQRLLCEIQARGGMVRTMAYRL